jgi:hypothetical protein
MTHRITQESQLHHNSLTWINHKHRFLSFSRCLRHHSREIGAREFALAKQVDLGEKKQKRCESLLSLPLKWYPMVSSMIHNLYSQPNDPMQQIQGLDPSFPSGYPRCVSPGLQNFFSFTDQARSQSWPAELRRILHLGAKPRTVIPAKLGYAQIYWFYYRI